jgi:hypothetical protein
MIKREKKDWLIVTFATTTDAMQMEKFCEKSKILGRLIPVPREITAGCGLAWKAEPNLQEEITAKLLEAGMKWEEMHVIRL